MALPDRSVTTFTTLGSLISPRIFDALFERAHDNGRLVRERKNGGIDGQRIEERLIALYVHHQLRVFRRGHLGGTVGTRSVIGTGHADRRSKSARGGFYASVVSGNNNAGQVAGLGGPLKDMLQHRLRADGSESFAWKTGGAVTGGNNAQNFTVHTRFYHKTPVIHLSKKKG